MIYIDDPKKVLNTPPLAAGTRSVRGLPRGIHTLYLCAFCRTWGAGLTAGILAFLPRYSRAALEIQYPVLPGFGNGQTLNQLAAGTLSIGDIFQFFFSLALLLSGTAIFISFFTAGFQFLTSSANPGKHSEARKKITGTIAGAAILFGVFIILRMINPQLITFSGQNFYTCYTPSAEELALSPDAQQEAQAERVADGLPPNCPTIQFPLFGGSGTPSSTGTSGTCSVTASGTPCAPSNLQAAFGSSAQNASMICNREGSNDPKTLNNKCLIGESCDYSVGLFQINLLPRCTTGLTYSCPRGGPVTCSIADQNALKTCAATYGVTLSFDTDPRGVITSADAATQIQKAEELWQTGQGHPQSFCGNHPSDCSLCYLWASASKSYCNTCPN